MSFLNAFLAGLFISNLVVAFGFGAGAFLEGEHRPRGRRVFVSAGILAAAALAAWALDALFVGMLGLGYLRVFVAALAGAAVYHAQRALGRFDGSVQPKRSDIGLAAATVVLAWQTSVHYPQFGDAVAAAAGGALGYVAALFLVHEALARMELEWVPRPFRGLPLAFITIGLVSLVFLALGALLLPGMR